MLLTVLLNTHLYSRQRNIINLHRLCMLHRLIVWDEMCPPLVIFHLLSFQLHPFLWFIFILELEVGKFNIFLSLKITQGSAEICYKIFKIIWWEMILSTIYKEWKISIAFNFSKTFATNTRSLWTNKAIHSSSSATLSICFQNIIWCGRKTTTSWKVTW